MLQYPVPRVKYVLLMLFAASAAAQTVPLDVSFKLTVPNLTVESGEPLAQLGQLFPRKLFDLALDDFQFVHELPLPLNYIRAFHSKMWLTTDVGLD